MRPSIQYRTCSKDAFTAAKTGRIYVDGTGCGNSGVLRGSGQFNWDVILIKETQIIEKHSFRDLMVVYARACVF
jgi:hypothetical protein